MPTPYVPSSYDIAQKKQLEQTVAELKGIYKMVIDKAIKIADWGMNPLDTIFTISKSKQKELTSVLTDFNTQVYMATVEGINSSWDIAVQKNNDLANAIYGKNLDDLDETYKSKVFSNNADARDAFIRQKFGGMDLSDRVWRNTKQLKEELELALELGINQGKSAQSIAKDIKQYLNNPDKLFRRVRDEKGVLRLSQAAKAYHPGKGVYRSSYKNAMRVARTEINGAYEASQQLKRQQQDFIVGVEIKVSPSHNTADDKNGISCFALQGRYPKNFDFSRKWHINCKCMSLNILKTEEELDEDVNEILNGNKPKSPSSSKSYVKQVPHSYVNYTDEQIKNWKNWKNPPLFYSKNYKLLENYDKNYVEVNTNPTSKVANQAVNKKVNTKISPSKSVDIESYIKSEGFIDLKGTDSIFQHYQKYSSDAKIKMEMKMSVDEYKAVLKSLDNYKWWSVPGLDGYYREVRNYLCIPTYKDKITPDQLAAIKECIVNLDSYIKLNKINENRVLYRRVHSVLEEQMRSLKLGDTFIDKTYSSTALSPQGYFGEYEIRILAPKGSRVCNLQNYREQEYLVDRNTKYKVIEVNNRPLTGDKYKQGPPYITLEIIN